MICSQFLHPRSGSFSCLHFFQSATTANTRNSCPLSLLVAGDTDGVAYFYNLKTMKLVAILNVLDQSCICVSHGGSSSLDLSKIRIPVPTAPQGLLSIGIEQVFSSSSPKASSKVLFWAQSRSMNVYVFDLLKDILKQEDDEESEDELSDNDDEESETRENNTTSQKISTLAIIGPFCNFSFAPVLCVNQFRKGKHSTCHENVLLFLCPNEVTMASTSSSNKQNEPISNGALQYCVVGANKMMMPLQSQDDQMKKKWTSPSFDIVSRGTGEFSFVSQNQNVTTKLGQIMTMEKNNIDHLENNRGETLCVASFESGDVCLFKITFLDFDHNHEEDLFDTYFYDTRIKMEILAKVRVATDPVMSLGIVVINDKNKNQQDAAHLLVPTTINLFCGSAEGNLICLRFCERRRTLVLDATEGEENKMINYLELTSTTSKALASSNSSSNAAGVGVIVPLDTNPRNNKDGSTAIILEVFLWNGERKRVEITENGQKNDGSVEITLSNSVLTSSLHTSMSSAVAVSFDSKIVQYVTSISQDATVRTRGRNCTSNEEASTKAAIFAIARKNGEISLVPLF